MIINLVHINITILGEHDYDFTVVSSSGDNWVFSCETADDRDSWVETIENMIKTR